MHLFFYDILYLCNRHGKVDKVVEIKGLENQVCQGNFVKQLELLIEELKEDVCEYNVGFVDGLIKAIQLFNKN